MTSPEELVQGLIFAIVDEVDLVLIDDARTRLSFLDQFRKGDRHEFDV